MIMNTKAFYTVKELANILGFSTRTIMRYIKSGRIHAFKPGMGKKSDWRINAIELQRIQDIGFEENIKSIEQYIKQRK